jgi:hypothetical protein
MSGRIAHHSREHRKGCATLVASCSAAAPIERTGQDRGADIKGRTNQAFFSKVSYTAPGTRLAGYPLRTLASVSRRVCCEGHPATGCQAIRSLELTRHVALVSEAGLGSSPGK